MQSDVPEPDGEHSDKYDEEQEKHEEPEPVLTAEKP